MSDKDGLRPEVEIARRVLAERFGARIEKTELLSTRSRARVTHIWLVDAKPLAPSTLICKYPFEKTHCAYDEWAGLQFLTEIASEAESAPRFLAGDAASGLILLQNLGDAQDLEDMRNRGDEPFREACAALAR